MAQAWQHTKLKPFLLTVPTFAVRETDVSRHNGGTSGAPLKPLRDDSAPQPTGALLGQIGAVDIEDGCFFQPTC